MATYTGGLRLRLVQDNFMTYLRDGLDALGWFDVGRANEPLQVIIDPLEHEIEIKPNMVAVSGEAISNYELEIGSGLEENRWAFFLDIYAESHAIGVHLAGDVRDLLRGKIRSIGYSTPFYSVFDLSLSSPVELFKCEMESVEINRARNYAKPYQKFWWIVSLDVVDNYDSDEDV